MSLLAAGALAQTERAKIEAHVAKCAPCQAMLVELQNLARGLTAAGRRLPEVEAPASLRRRWMTAVRGSAREEVGRDVFTAPGAEAVCGGALGTARPTAGSVFDWLSSRQLAWGSLAAMWTLVLFFRFAAPDAPKPASVAVAPPSLREVLLALKVDDRSAGRRADASVPTQRKQSRPEALPPRSQRPDAEPPKWEAA